VLRGLVVDALSENSACHFASCVLVQAIAKSYGAKSVTFSDEAEKKIELYTRSGFDKLPICMAKTQYRSASLSPGCRMCKYNCVHACSIAHTMVQFADGVYAAWTQLQRRPCSERSAQRLRAAHPGCASERRRWVFVPAHRCANAYIPPNVPP